MAEKISLSYCAQAVRAEDYPHYLATLFVPALAREAVFALLAWNLEVSKIAGSVSEPMIGHIKFAWWREALDDLFAGKPMHGHPVLEALTPIIAGSAKIQILMNEILDEYEAGLEAESPIRTQITSTLLLRLLAAIAEPSMILHLDADETTGVPKWVRAQQLAEQYASKTQSVPLSFFARLKLIWQLMRC